MAQYLITYDNKPPRNYTSLYQLMASWKAIRLADSVWLANLQGPAGPIRNIVMSKLQLNDLVAVVELKHGADWAVSTAVPAAAKTWLSNNVTPSQAAA
jgi:hypothetical protein